MSPCWPPAGPLDNTALDNTRADPVHVYLMREELSRVLDIDRTTPMTDRTIDITTTGRRSGEPRRTVICFYRSGGALYLSGMPRPRPRDWLANLAADPHLTLHFTRGLVADVPAVAEVVTDPAERRRVLPAFAEDVNFRSGPGSADPEEWVARSPLARITFPGS